MYIRGFTIVETIIYTALVGLVLSAIVSFSLVVVDVKVKNSAIWEVNNNSRQVINTLTSLLKSAESIVSPAIEGTASSLEFITDANKVINISVLDGRLIINDGGDIFNLTSELVVINNLIFSNYGRFGLDSIRFSFIIESAGNIQTKYQYKQTLNTAVTLRK